MPQKFTWRSALVGCLWCVVGCASEALIEDGEHDPFFDGKADGGVGEGSPEAIGVLALVNDEAMGVPELTALAGVTSRVARNIVTHRDGNDGKPRTGDDDRFDTLAELDAIPYIGPKTLAALIAAARERGLIPHGARIDVIFSPQPAQLSHNARLASLMHAAQHSIDVAIYSFSDTSIFDALAHAVERGLLVRVLYEAAKDHKNVTDPGARAATMSGRLEAKGIDVRYVNKILHHKLVILDGPRDDLGRAATAQVVTGSANYANTAATVFDESTLFVANSAEVAATYQAEFDRLWRGSRDFEGPAAAQPESSLGIAPDDVDPEPGIGALFTSANFTPGGADGTTWSVDKSKLEIGNAWVAAIADAKSSIHIASGHLRLRQVAEALVAKKAADPAIDIAVYLDQQEWISSEADVQQHAEVEECESTATTQAQIDDCRDSGVWFSKTLVDAGIDVRFKTYSYRWVHSHAPQMHSKYMIIDGRELFSGSYNLSINSEQSSFENVLQLSAPQFQSVIDAFEQNFATLHDTGRVQGVLETVRDEIATASQIPLVFPSMALSWQEYEELRALIREHCPQVDTEEFAQNPDSHKQCAR